MSNESHQASIVVEQTSVVNFFGAISLRGIDLAIRHLLGKPDRWNLRTLFQIVDAMEDRMLQRQIHKLAIWKHLFHLTPETVPFVLAPEVIDHHKAAVQKVGAQRLAFIFFKIDIARFNHVDERIVEQSWIRQFQDHTVGIGMQ